jgi:RNA polymerase sigma-70 factor (ECF subfamily)
MKRGGSAVNDDWKRYREMLLTMIARKGILNGRLRKYVEASVIVQDTLAAAWEGRDARRAETEAQRIAWLIEILEHKLIDKMREVFAKKRDVRREQSLQGLLSQSTAKVREFVDQKQPSPSQDAIRREFLTRVIQALEQLAENQRDVVYMRDLMQMPMAAIAEEMGKSEKAVAGLWRRGHLRLREVLKEFESGFGSANGCCP